MYTYVYVYKPIHTYLLALIWNIDFPTAISTSNTQIFNF